MRLVRFACWSALGVLLAGCYTLEPAGGVTPDVGKEVAFDINDAGRVALGGAMGPEIEQVQGRLVSKENGDYLVAVTGVRFLRGGEQVWKGEQVHVKPDYVSVAYERKFSPGRTAVLGAAGVAALAYIVSRPLLGSGPRDAGTVPPDTAKTQRIPR